MAENTPITEQTDSPSQSENPASDINRPTVSGTEVQAINGLSLDIARSDVVEIRIVDTDIVLILADGRRIFVRDGAVQAIIDPSFSISFSDGVEEVGQSLIQAAGTSEIGRVALSGPLGGQEETVVIVQVPVPYPVSVPMPPVPTDAPDTTSAAADRGGPSIRPWQTYALIGAPLIGGGIVAAAVISSTPAPNVPAPTIFSVTGDDVISAAEKLAGVTITGTAQPTSVVEVRWGSTLKTVSVDGAGFWSVQFDTVEIPAAGSRVTVTATAIASGVRSEAATRDVNIDTPVPQPNVPAPTVFAVTGDDVVTADEKSVGVTVSGTAQPRSDVEIRWGTTLKTVSVDGAGFWAVQFDATEIPAAGARVTLTATAVSVGVRSEATTRDVNIETPVPPQRVSAPAIFAVTGDDVVTVEEKAAGVTVSGWAQAGSEVTITWEGTDAVKTDIVDDRGFWTVRFEPDEIPADGPSLTITAIAEILGVKSEPATREININTPVPPQSVPAPAIFAVTGDDVVTAEEKDDGVTISGWAPPGSQVEIIWGGVVKTAPVGEDGFWQVDFDASEIPADGDNVTITARAITLDVSSEVATRAVIIDTTPPTVAITSVLDALSNPEPFSREQAITIAGTGEAGSTIFVKWEGLNRVVTVNELGDWEVTIVPAELPVQVAERTISVIAVDRNGNKSTATVEETVEFRMTTDDVLRLSTGQFEQLTINDFDKLNELNVLNESLVQKLSKEIVQKLPAEKIQKLNELGLLDDLLFGDIDDHKYDLLLGRLADPLDNYASDGFDFSKIPSFEFSQLDALDLGFIDEQEELNLFNDVIRSLRGTTSPIDLVAIANGASAVMEAVKSDGSILMLEHLEALNLNIGFGAAGSLISPNEANLARIQTTFNNAGETTEWFDSVSELRRLVAFADGSPLRIGSSIETEVKPANFSLFAPVLVEGKLYYSISLRNPPANPVGTERFNYQDWVKRLGEDFLNPEGFTHTTVHGEYLLRVPGLGRPLNANGRPTNNSFPLTDAFDRDGDMNPNSVPTLDDWAAILDSFTDGPRVGATVGYPNWNAGAPAFTSQTFDNETGITLLNAFGYSYVDNYRTRTDYNAAVIVELVI